MEEIYKKIESGTRVSEKEALELFKHARLIELGMLADFCKRKIHKNPIVTYVRGRNINYTNICWVDCTFCAFYRSPKHKEGYLLSKQQILQKIKELKDLGGTEILMQGGLNKQLKVDYFQDLFSSIKEKYNVHLHALSPTEIIFIAKLSKLSIEETIRKLKISGLDSIPGGGAEILVDDVRKQISPRKDMADEWLNVMKIAHKLDLKTTATMTYGHVESYEDRIEHLSKIRKVQDETGGFTAFIPWNFQPNNTSLGKKLNYYKTSGCEYLKTVAISRIFLDNIKNIQASYVTQGSKIAQISLMYGVNDFGSTMMEEHVVSSAGTFNLLSEDKIKSLIEDLGYQPKIRNTKYELLN